MPLRNLDEAITTLEGEPVQDKDGNTHILRTLVANALVMDNPEKQDSFEKKESRANLARKIIKGGNIELNTTEVTEIRNAAAKGLSTAVCGQLALALDRDVPN